MKRTIAIFAAASLALAAQAQISSLGPVVIGSTGNFVLDNPSNLSISSTCGETVIPTFSTTQTTHQTRILTQGFQQPKISNALVLTASAAYSDVSCTGANDGQATVNASGGGGGYTYLWSTGDSTASVDSLVPGTYTVTVTDVGGLSVVQTVVINDGSDLCGIHVYKGFTPNGDGFNDFWYIEYLELFLPNSVKIFDRWGSEVWAGTDYDNSTVYFAGKNKQGNDLPDGTYFYILTVGDKSKKGWVELTR